jgi:hypothetical protein
VKETAEDDEGEAEKGASRWRKDKWKEAPNSMLLFLGLI